MDHEKLLKKIAMRLQGINEEDLTTAERQINKILVDAGYNKIDNNGDIVST